MGFDSPYIRYARPLSVTLQRTGRYLFLIGCTISRPTDDDATHAPNAESSAAAARTRMILSVESLFCERLVVAWRGIPLVRATSTNPNTNSGRPPTPPARPPASRASQQALRFPPTITLVPPIISLRTDAWNTTPHVRWKDSIARAYLVRMRDANLQPCACVCPPSSARPLGSASAHTHTAACPTQNETNAWNTTPRVRYAFDSAGVHGMQPCPYACCVYSAVDRTRLSIAASAHTCTTWCLTRNETNAWTRRHT